MTFGARLLALAATASALIAPQPRVQHPSRKERGLQYQLDLHTEPWLNKLGHSTGKCVYTWHDSKKTEDLLKTLSGNDNLVEAQDWVGKLGALLRPVLAHKNARGWAIESYKKNWERVNTDGDSSLSLGLREAGLRVRDATINLLEGDLTESKNSITPSRALVGASTPSTRRVSVPADDLSEESYPVRLLGMLVAEEIYVQDLATFQVFPGQWYDDFVALGPTGDYARKPTAVDVISVCLDSAFITGQVSEQDHNVACCWEGIRRCQNLVALLDISDIREKYGLVSKEEAFLAAHVPPSYSSGIHIHNYNTFYNWKKEDIFKAVENNPSHPGIGIRLYDLHTGKLAPYLHRFARADVLRARELFPNSLAALRALSATEPFRTFVEAAGRISGVELPDGLRYENSHEPWVPACHCLGYVFCGYWCDGARAGQFGSTLMLATQVAYFEADGVTRLLDKGVTPCDAGDLAAARAARDAGLTDLQRAKLAAEDRVWDAWPAPVPEELRRAADAARKAAAAEAKAFAAVMEATAPAMKAAAGAKKACSAAARKAAAAARKAAAAATKADAAAKKAGAAAEKKARAPKRSRDPQGALESAVVARVVARRSGARPSFALDPAEEARAAAAKKASAVAKKAAAAADSAVTAAHSAFAVAACAAAAAEANPPKRERLVKWQLSGCTVAVTPVTI